MANKVYNMEGGLHSAAAYSAFENALYGSCVASATDFVATAGTGMVVNLSAGNGLISTGTGFARRIASDATNNITIATAASSARIDSIVAYIDGSVTPTTSVVDNTNGILKFTSVSGTASATPSAPTTATIQSAIGAGNPYMVLWDVTVPANATSLTSATFTDHRTIASVTSVIASLQAQLNLNDIQSRTLTFNGNRNAYVTLAQNSAGTLFKFYGQFYFDNNTTSAINLNTSSFSKVAVPGASNIYGFSTGLTLNSAPSSAYMIAQAGYGAFGTLGFNKTNTGYMDAGNFFAVQIYVGSNGQIYIAPYGNNWNSGNEVVSANTRSRIFWLPTLYWNGDFGGNSQA